MRRALLSLLAGLLLLGAPTSVRAEEDKSDASSLLKVPLAEARPTGFEGEETITTPAPTPSLLAEADPLAAGEPVPPADDGITRPAFPLSRYEPLWQRSPFQLESVAPPVESAGLAQRFAFTGIAEINGEPMAFVMERATQNRLMVKADSTKDGLSLVQVDVQQKYADSSATLRQGTEVGVVRFEAVAAMPPGMPQPGRPPQAVAQPPTQLIPGMHQPPGLVPPVPRPGDPSSGQVQGGQGQIPPPRVIRRRVLVTPAP